MKKLLLILFTICAYAATAQITVTVSGHITNVQTGHPVTNHEIFIMLTNNSDPNGGITTVILTDSAG